MTGSETSSAGPVVTPGAGARVRRQRQRAAGQVAGLRDDAARGGPPRRARRRRLVRRPARRPRATASASSPAATRIPRSRPRCSRSAASRREEEGASESRRVAADGRADPGHRRPRRHRRDHRRTISASSIERLAPKSYMIVPLAARGRVLGSMTLLSTRAGRHYTESDLAFAAGAGRALRAGHRQRAPARPRRALAEPARHRLLHRAGRPGPRRPRPALRARQRDLRRLQRAPGGRARRPHGRPSSCGPPAWTRQTVVPSYRQRPGHRRAACSTAS